MTTFTVGVAVGTVVLVAVLVAAVVGVWVAGTVVAVPVDGTDVGLEMITVAVEVTRRVAVAGVVPDGTGVEATRAAVLASSAELWAATDASC